MALRPITDFASQILKPYINNQDKAYAANIAPVETSPATSAHTAGTQIIYNGVLYDVTADINANDALATTGAGANIAAADDVSEQISNVKQALTDKVTDNASATSKASAAWLSITDAMGVNAKSAVAKITPLQAGTGTPSPSNVRAISGWDSVRVGTTKKNLYGGERLADDIVAKFSGVAKTNETVVYVSNGTNNAPLPAIPFKENTQYTVILKFSCSVNGGYANMLINYTDGTTQGLIVNGGTADTILNHAFVSFAGKTIKNIQGAWHSGTTTLYYNECGVFEGALTTAEFEAYKGHEVTFSLGDTIYGGELDVETGVLTVDKGYTTFANVITNYNPTSLVFLGSIAGMKSLTSGSPQFVNSCFEPDNNSNSVSGMSDKHIRQIAGQIAIKDLDITSTPDFITAYGSQQLVYPLETPYTIQLTPQDIQLLEGLNNVYANSGNVAVDYYKQTVGNLAASVSDTQKKVNELKVFNEIFGTVENGDTASKPYSQGDYFVRGNQMAKAKTSIAKGATFTLNTNYEVKSLAEILKTIETT